VIFAGLGDKERALEAIEPSAAAGPLRGRKHLIWPTRCSFREARLD
jgi:hypothetical protein